MSNLPKISKEEFLQSISEGIAASFLNILIAGPEMTGPRMREMILDSIQEGVKDAILTMTETGDGYSGPIIREEFLDKIKDGVSESNFCQENLYALQDIARCLEGIGQELFNIRKDMERHEPNRSSISRFT